MQNSPDTSGIKRYVLGEHIMVKKEPDGSYLFWNDPENPDPLGAQKVARDIDVPYLGNGAEVGFMPPTTKHDTGKYILKIQDFRLVPPTILNMFTPPKGTTVNLWGTDIGVRRGKYNEIILNAGAEFAARLKSEGIDSVHGDHYGTLRIFPPGINKALALKEGPRKNHQPPPATAWIMRAAAQNAWMPQHLTATGRHIMRSILTCLQAQQPSLLPAH